MMTMTLRIALVLVSLGTFSLMMRKIRQSKLQIESAIFWIVLSIVLVVFSIFPSVADFCVKTPWNLRYHQLFVPVCDLPC